MMDTKRKKELLEAYKNRHPEMGAQQLCNERSSVGTSQLCSSCIIDCGGGED